MKKRKKIKSWQKGRLISLAIIGVIALVIGLIVLPRVVLTKNVREEMAAIRAAGQPTTIPELEAWREPVPAEQNAAPLYLDALRAFDATYLATPPLQFDQVPEFGGDFIGPEVVFDDAKRALVSEFLELYKDTLSKIREASTYSECQYPVQQFREVIGIRVEELERIPRLVKLLSLEAALAVHDGNLAQTVDSFLAAMKLIRSLQGECHSGYFIVRADSLQVVLRSLAWAFDQRDFDDSTLQRFASAFADQDDPRFIQPALIGDRVEVLELLKLDFPQTGVFGTHDQLCLPILRGFAKTIASSELARAESFEAGERIFLEMRDHTLYGIIGHSVWEPSFLPFASLEASTQLGQTMIAIERYRLVDNHLPDSLEQLVPEFLDVVPKDPLRWKIHTLRTARLRIQNTQRRP